MRPVRFVALSEDGQALVLADEVGRLLALPLDERVAGALHAEPGPAPALGVATSVPEPPPSLSPRDIQTRIRAGELAEPPLTADGRASLTARLAADHGVDLAHCHAYGDSLADLPLLELVGHPHAINPDFRLSREARRRRWPIETWGTEKAAI